MEEEVIVSQEDSVLTPALEEASQPFVGRWHRLVSQTNWEKGRIILQWRRALQEAGASASAYSDEAWSRLVGGVSPQHVGRLRRVYERFGQSADQYPGLYWSHFMAALDWPDAEMWLEGAVQNRWSVARMQSQRSQTLGVAGSARSASAEIDLDEDAESSLGIPPTAIMPEMEEVRTPGEGSSKGAGSAQSELLEEDSPIAEWEGEHEESLGEAAPASVAESAPAAFAELPPMPDDVADAFEAFKLAIVRHKLDGWKEISCRQIVKVLDALKRFALASDSPPSPEH